MKRAFTLIELLVVIAIIAILAAILFPVFAQAKVAAKKSQSISNVKQLGTCITMYITDYDDQYVPGFRLDSGWTGDALWMQNVMPYIKNVGIFTSPVDSMTGPINGADSWMGWYISYAVNGTYSPNWCCAPNWNTGFPLIGVSGLPGQNWWLAGASKNQSEVNLTAETILISEKHTSDLKAYDSTLPGNTSNFWPLGTFGGDPATWGGWGPSRIPDGTRSLTASYPDGPNGSVSAKFNGLSTFAYLDGHAKALKPAMTNPDPVNRPKDNQWDATR